MTDEELGRIRVAVFTSGLVTGPQVVALVDEVRRLRATLAQVDAIATSDELDADVALAVIIREVLHPSDAPQ